MIRRLASPLSLLLVLALVAPVLAGCQQSRSGEPVPDEETADVVRLSETEYVEAHAGDGVLLDVRRPDEFSAGHLVGARNINLQSEDFRARVDSLDRNETYYLYCRTGNRSGQAAAIMAEMGFRSLYNVGGFEGLASAGAETTR